MSQNTPECPLYNPLNCREYNNPNLCALVRADRCCKKKNRHKQGQNFSKQNQPAS